MIIFTHQNLVRGTDHNRSVASALWEGLGWRSTGFRFQNARPVQRRAELIPIAIAGIIIEEHCAAGSDFTETLPHNSSPASLGPWILDLRALPILLKNQKRHMQLR